MKMQELFGSPTTSFFFFVVGLGLAVGFASLWFIEDFTSRSVTYLLIALLGTVTFVPLINRFIRRSFDLAEPAIWFAAFYFVNFGIYGIYIFTFGSKLLGFGPEVENVALVNAAMAVSILGLLCFWFGYNMRIGREIARSFPRLPRRWKKNCVLPVALLCAVIAWGLRFYIMISKGGSVIGWLTTDKDVIFRLGSGIFTYTRITYLNLGAAAILLIFIANRVSSRRKYWLLFWVLFILEILFLLTEGKRLFVPSLLLGILLAYYMTSKRGHVMSSRMAVLAVIILTFAVLLYPIITIARYKGIRGFSTAFSSDIFSPLDLFRNISANLHDLDSLALIMRDVPGKVPYTYGSELLRISYAWVPRKFWPEKPIINPGDIFREQLAPPGYALEGTAVTVSLPGQFYWDLGLVGVVLGMSLVGVIWRFWYEYLVRPKGNLSNVLLVSVMFVWCFMALLQTLVNFVAYVFIFLLLAFVSLLVAGKGKHSLAINL